MSPLAPSSVRGYVDMQRVENWDSPTLYQSSNVVIGAAETTGVLDVSRYAYLGGHDFVTAGSVAANLSWYTDPAGTINIATRGIVLDSGIVEPAQYRLPNLGPFVVVTWNKVSAGNATHSAILLGTNRVHPLELIPLQPVVIDINAAAIGAGVTLTNYPTDNYAGPVQVAVNQNQAGTLFFDYLTSANVWSQYNVLALPAGGWQTVTVVTPPGAWRTRIQNSAGAAGVYSLKVITPSTGAI